MHNAYIGKHFRRTKITRKASDAAENLQLYRVVRFFHPRSSCTMTHILADVQRITLNASCMMISGGRTKQLDIFCRITGFTSDFLSFIVVELIRFFHGAIQLGHNEVLCHTLTGDFVVSICMEYSDNTCTYQSIQTRNVMLAKQEAQLMLTTGSTRLAVSRGQQTWYHSTCYI